jgi:hypothetical protein
MKNTIVQTHEVENKIIVPVTKSKLVLEAPERFELFQEKFLDTGYRIQIDFEEKYSDLLKVFMNSGRSINELSYFPKPVVLCTATLTDGERIILSACADAPIDWTTPYKGAETMALMRLFDRLGIPSIVHEHEITEFKSMNQNNADSDSDSIHLTGVDTDLPVDFDTFLSRSDLKKQQNDESAMTQVETETQVKETAAETKADVEDEAQSQVIETAAETKTDVEDEAQSQVIETTAETKAEFSLTSETVIASQTTEPVFPSDLPKPFQAKLKSKLSLKHGDAWANYIPRTKQDCYTILGIQ